ncbi:MAG: hypothetical protein V4712_10630 [Pseudomonadota bacterium]
MTPDPLHIAQGEQGVLRVFTADLTPDHWQDMQQGDSAAAVYALLGATGLKAAQVEVVRIADLGDLGLGGYLAAGHDVPEAALRPDAARLKSLTGTVLIVSSGALSDTGGTLRPADGVVPFATYLQVGAAPADLWPAPSPAPPEATPAPPPPPASSLVPAGPIIALAVVLVALAVWWIA